MNSLCHERRFNEIFIYNMGAMANCGDELQSLPSGVVGAACHNHHLPSTTYGTICHSCPAFQQPSFKNGR